MAGSSTSLKNSDMTIKLSDGTELQCHRNIVCSQCSFFAKALEPGRFKESYTGVVKLPNDPPEAVTALIEFLYTSSYTISKNLDRADQVLFHAEVYEVAKIYDLDDLWGYAESALFIALTWKRPDHFVECIPVLPDLARILSEHDPDKKTLVHKELVTLTIEQTEAHLRWNHQAWDALNDVPEFMERIAGGCKDKWEYRGCSSAGIWLDRWGGENAVGVAIRALSECKTKHCHFKASSNLWEA
ncbi:putative btb poz domain protein [Diplodia seriata]|uniref:Putative btb poz domain protein n=1 Tax=Diplodia seriata TaxID=420778 RepID=A0A0G2GA12_9PEZI|nr:putative btb poz domain protein [Diplodia seriata]